MEIYTSTSVTQSETTRPVKRVSRKAAYDITWMARADRGIDCYAKRVLSSDPFPGGERSSPSRTFPRVEQTGSQACVTGHERSGEKEEKKAARTNSESDRRVAPSDVGASARSSLIIAEAARGSRSLGDAISRDRKVQLPPRFLAAGCAALRCGGCLSRVFPRARTLPIVHAASRACTDYALLRVYRYCLRYQETR